MRNKKNYLFFIPLTIAFFLTALTFYYTPMLGECEQRGLLNHEPNFAYIDDFFRWQERDGNVKNWNILECPACFLSRSEKGQINSQDGFGRSVFQPVLFFQDGPTKWPLFFQYRQGASGLLVVKALNHIFKIDMLLALTIFHFSVIFISILFFWLFTKKFFGLKIAFISSLIYSTSPITLIAAGPFISEKMLLFVPWVYLYIASFSNRYAWMALGFSVALFSFSIKISAVLFFAPVIIFYFENFKKYLLPLSLSFIISFAPVVAIWNIEGAYIELITNAHYFKAFKYWMIFLRDSFYMWFSPTMSQEYFLGWSNWLYPISTGDIVGIHYTSWNPLKPFLKQSIEAWFFVIFWFALILCSRNMDINNKSLNKKILYSFFASAFLLFIGGHEIKTMSHYFFPLFGFCSLYFANRIVSFNKKLRLCIYSISILSICYSTLYFVKNYREKGPILTFNASFYSGLAKSLEHLNINRPIMYFDSEFGMIDVFSKGRVIPYYFHESYLNSLDDTWKLAKEGHILLQLNPDWVDSLWASNETIEKIKTRAQGQGIAIKTISTFNYRGKKQYELFHFKNLRDQFHHNPPLDAIFFNSKRQFSLYR